MTKPRALWGNASALFAIQIANYILPFLLIPYLTHTLGAHLYGVIAFGLALTQIACIVTDYGFNLSATYQIAKNHNNKEKIREVYGAVLACKLWLLIPVTALLGAFIIIPSQYSEYRLYFSLLIIPIIGQTFQPIWVFQGIEKMSYITIYTVISRITYLALVIILVKSPEDHYWIALSQGAANIAATAIGVFILAKMGYSPTIAGFKSIRATFKDSTEFFWSRAAVATYTAGGAFFVGIISTPLQVAYYSAAEQVYKGGQALFSPLAQALYPYMAKNKNLPLFFNILKIVITASFIGVTLGFSFGKIALTTLFGPSFTESYPILLIFLITLLINTPSIFIGYPLTGALGDSKSVNTSVFYGGAIQVFLLGICYTLQYSQGIYVAITVLVAEFVVLALRIRAAKKIYSLATS